MKTEKPEDNKCPNCKKGDAQQEHTCPYSVEINDDSETLCNCCIDCENECSGDI